MNKLLINIANIFLDINKLKTISKILRKSPKKLFEELVNKPKQFAEQIKRLGQVQRKQLSGVLERVNQAQSDTANLSSSWIKRGHWRPIGVGGSGELTIWTKKGSVGYTYPGVDYKVWKAMKGAKGKNGGGAGSVFWALYLRQFKSSSFGQFLKRIQKLSGIKGFI